MGKYNENYLKRNYSTCMAYII